MSPSSDLGDILFREGVFSSLRLEVISFGPRAVDLVSSKY